MRPWAAAAAGEVAEEPGRSRALGDRTKAPRVPALGGPLLRDQDVRLVRTARAAAARGDGAAEAAEAAGVARTGGAVVTPGDVAEAVRNGVSVAVRGRGLHSSTIQIKLSRV